MNEMNNWKALEIAILWKENYEVNNRNLEIIQVEEERVIKYLKNEEIKVQKGGNNLPNATDITSVQVQIFTEIC